MVAMKSSQPCYYCWLPALCLVWASLPIVILSGSAVAQELTPADSPADSGPLVPEPESADSLESMKNRFPEIAQAIAKFEAGEFDEALALTQAAAGKHSELPPGEVIMSSFHFAARDLPGAMRMLDKAALAHPNDPSAFLDLGNIALLQNRLTDASLHFEKTAKILQMFDGNAERKQKAIDRHLKGISLLAEKKEDWTEAEEHLSQLSVKEPDNAEVQIRLARAMFRNKQYKPAYELMKNSKAVKDAEASPEMAMAQFYSEMQDFSNAKKWIDYAVKQSPEDLRIRLGAVQWHWQRGNGDEVKVHAKKAVDIDPTSLPARMLYGMYAHYAGELDTAAKEFQAVLTRAPDNFSARNNLAMVLADQAQADSLVGAKRIAEENLKAAGNNTLAAGTMAWTHFKLGQYEEATRLMQAVGQAGGLNNFNNAYFMARVADRAGQREQAVALLKQVLEQPQLFEMRGAAEKWLQAVDK